MWPVCSTNYLNDTIRFDVLGKGASCGFCSTNSQRRAFNLKRQILLYRLGTEDNFIHRIVIISTVVCWVYGELTPSVVPDPVRTICAPGRQMPPSAPRQV